MPWPLNRSEAGGGPCFVTNHHAYGLASMRITWFVLENSKHLMTGPEGNSKFCFPESLNGKHWDSTYSLEFWNWKFIKPRCKTAVVGQQYTVIYFAMLPAQRFWRETVSLLDVTWPRSNQWERALFRGNLQLYNYKVTSSLASFQRPGSCARNDELACSVRCCASLEVVVTCGKCYSEISYVFRWNCSRAPAAVTNSRYYINDTNVQSWGCP